jgi:hypothetical protein
MRHIVLASIVCLVLTGVTRRADAEGDTARAARFFRTASEAYARHDFREAALQFESAYRTAPRGAAIYNAGLAWEAAGDFARAANDYTTLLGDGSAVPEQRADATSRLRTLEGRVARLVVNGPADARASLDDGAEEGLPLGVHLAPGHHTLNVTYASGATESVAVDAAPGAEQVVQLKEPSEGSNADEGVSLAPGGPAPDTTMRRTFAWVALGGAVVASGLAAAFYAQGSSALNQFETGNDTDRKLHDQAVNDRTLAQVFAGAAGALGVTAAVLYFTSSPPSAQPPAATVLRVGPTGAALRIAF